jgi:trimeric autotransporter adhesin
MPMNNRILRPLARPLLLDAVPGAAAAYSLRQLSNAYTGPVVTVRRSSDNAEEDFKASEIDDGTLAAFCGAGDGLVKTWFDQSGNGNDASNTTAAQQPKIVSSGVVVTEGVKPAIKFDKVDDYLQASSVVVSQPDTIFSVNTQDTGPSVVYDGVTGRQQLAPNSTFERIYAGVMLTSPKTISVGELRVYCSVFNGIASSLHRDGVQIVSGDAGNLSLIGFRIGTFQPGVAPHGGTISEIIIYPSDQSANRQLVEGNLAWYY